MSTGQRIKTARKKAGLTQAALAERLNISYVNISQLEKDQRNPTLETLRRIAAALGVPVQDLVGDWNALAPEDVKDFIIYGGPIGRVVENMQQLNLTGCQRVEAYSADMLQIAAYREDSPQPAQNVPESTPPAPENADTTPDKKPPESP